MTCRNHPKRRARLRILCAPIALCGVTALAATPEPSAEQCIVGDHAIGCASERSIIELTTPRKNANGLQELVQDKLASGQCRLFDYGERVQVTSTHGNERTQIRRPGDKTSYWIASSWSRPATECQGTPTASALHQKLGLPDAPKQQADADEGAPSFADERAAPSDQPLPPFANVRTPPFSAERAPAFAEDHASPGQRWRDEDDDEDDERIAYDRGSHGPPSLRSRPSRSSRYDDGDDDDGDEDIAYERERPRPRWASRPLPSSRYAHDCAYKPVMSDADLAACSYERR